MTSLCASLGNQTEISFGIQFFLLSYFIFATFVLLSPFSIMFSLHFKFAYWSSCNICQENSGIIEAQYGQLQRSSNTYVFNYTEYNIVS